jgi:hypothetical protein
MESRFLNRKGTIEELDERSACVHCNLPNHLRIVIHAYQLACASCCCNRLDGFRSIGNSAARNWLQNLSAETRLLEMLLEEVLKESMHTHVVIWTAEDKKATPTDEDVADKLSGVVKSLVAVPITSKNQFLTYLDAANSLGMPVQEFFRRLARNDLGSYIFRTFDEKPSQSPVTEIE